MPSGRNVVQRFGEGVAGALFVLGIAHADAPAGLTVDVGRPGVAECGLLLELVEDLVAHWVEHGDDCHDFWHAAQPNRIRLSGARSIGAYAAPGRLATDLHAGPDPPPPRRRGNGRVVQHTDAPAKSPGGSPRRKPFFPSWKGSGSPPQTPAHADLRYRNCMRLLAQTGEWR